MNPSYFNNINKKLSDEATFVRSLIDCSQFILEACRRGKILEDVLAIMTEALKAGLKVLESERAKADTEEISKSTREAIKFYEKAISSTSKFMD